MKITYMPDINVLGPHRADEHALWHYENREDIQMFIYESCTVLDLPAGLGLEFMDRWGEDLGARAQRGMIIRWEVNGQYLRHNDGRLRRAQEALVWLQPRVLPPECYDRGDIQLWNRMTVELEDLDGIEFMVRWGEHLDLKVLS